MQRMNANELSSCLEFLAELLASSFLSIIHAARIAVVPMKNSPDVDRLFNSKKVFCEILWRPYCKIIKLDKIGKLIKNSEEIMTIKINAGIIVRVLKVGLRPILLLAANDRGTRKKTAALV